jgi:hypothetical protein
LDVRAADSTSGGIGWTGMTARFMFTPQDKNTNGVSKSNKSRTISAVYQTARAGGFSTDGVIRMLTHGGSVSVIIPCG